MRRNVVARFFNILAFLVLAAIASIYGIQQALAIDNSITLSGSVSDQYGHGVQGVVVKVTDPSTSNVLYSSSGSDASGLYTLEVTPGVYDIHFLPPSNTGWGEVVQTNVSLIDSQTINVQFSPLPDARVFSGTLRDNENLPIVNAELVLSHNATQFITVHTNGVGHFAFTIPAGTYTLNGSISGRQDYPAAVNFQNLPVDLTSQNISQDLKIPLSTVQLAVRAVDSMNTPVEGTTIHSSTSLTAVSLFPGSTPVPVYSTAMSSGTLTDTSGEASGLLFQGSQVNSVCVKFAQIINIICNQSGVTMDSNKIVTLVKPASRVFTGTLKDASGNPIQGMELNLSVGAGGVSTVTDAAGHFTMSVSAGVRQLSMDGNNINGYPKHVSVGGQAIDLTEGDVELDLQIPFSTATIGVVTKDATGNVLPNVSVGGGNTQHAPLYENGPVVSITGGGSYLSDAEGRASLVIFGDENTAVSAGSICANFGNPYGNKCNTAPVFGGGEVELTRAAINTFSGVFRDASGNPLPGVQISIPQGAGGITGTTNANGQFTISSAPGVYPVSISITGIDGYPQAINIEGQIVDTSTGNVFREYQLPLTFATLTVAIKDVNGSPVANTFVNVASTTIPIALYNGDASSTASIGNGSLRTDGAGLVSARYALGTEFLPGRICTNFGVEVGQVCNTATVTFNSDTTVVLQPVPLAPAAPTNLSAVSPTKIAPALSWTATTGATSYRIYRNNVLIDTVTSTSYTDTTATQGVHGYYVTAANDSAESASSNAISVTYDKTGPVITITSPIVNSTASGTAVVVTGAISDNLSAIQNGQVVVHLRKVKENGKLDGFLNTLYASVDSNGNWSVTFDSTMFVDGNYGVTVLANDVAGNSQTASGGVSLKPFSIDN